MFENQTIQIKDNVLMSGDNKSGKSTILDAIQYILTAGKTKFNMAANERSTRTLEGYVRGKLGIEGKKFLRDDFVVAHVALEFQTSGTNTKHLVLGAVIEVARQQSPKIHFYKINSALQEEWFIENQKIRDITAFRYYLKSQNIQIDIPTKATQRNTMFATALGVKSKYMDLVPKALAFKPVEDLNNFIFQFLLDDEPVDIDALRDSIRSYRSINQKLTEEEINLAELTKIREIYFEIEEERHQLETITFIEELLKEKIVLSNKARSEQKLENSKIELSKIEKQLPIKAKHLKENQKKKFQLEQDNELQVINDAEKELIGLDINFDREEKNYKRYLILLKETNIHLQKVNLSLDEKLLSSKESLSKKRAKHLEEFSKTLHQLKEEYNHADFQYDLKLDEVNQKIKATNNQIKMLEKRQFQYSAETKKLQEVLIKELSNIYGESVDVKPLCELLEMKDESWRNAAEGFLGRNRFNLIVEPKYFVKAMEIYRAYTQKAQIYDVRVADVSQTRNYQAEDETLAQQLICKNQFAQGYINFLLGRVKCVEEVAQLRNHRTAITKECMTYSQYAVYAIHPKAYKNPYIGKQAFETQLKIKRTELSELREKQQIIEKKQKNTGIILSSLEKINPMELRNLDQNLEIYWDYLAMKEEKEALLATLKNNLSLLSKIEALEGLTLIVESYEKDIKGLTEKSGGLKNVIEESTNNLRMIETQLDLIFEAKESYKQENIAIFEEAQLQLTKILTKKQGSISETSKIVQLEQQKIRRSYKDNEDLLKDSMMKFNNRTSLGYGISLDSIQQYLDKFNQLSEIDIIRTKDSLNLAKEKSEKAFNESFIAKLSDNINRAKKSIKDLNRGLERQSFNGDTYKFVYEANPDPAFKQYYEIVTGNNSLYMDNLFLDGLMEQERDLMEMLFNKLAYFDDERKDERELRKYTDYRNYMSYDIIVTHENGDITKLSTVIKEKSGGETQTPFYVTIASCFEQMMSRLSIIDAGCVVLFDEAFNNMDEARIKAMMQFYNNLNIQIIVVVPPNRVSTILPYVQTAVGVTRRGNQSFAMELYHEKDN